MNDPRPFYRVGRHNPQNVYRHDGPADKNGTFVGVFFTPDTGGPGDGARYARLAVHGLNAGLAAGAEHGSPVNASDEAWDRFIDASGDTNESPGSDGVVDADIVEYVWLVASALEPGSRAHAVHASTITRDTPTYRELLIETLCSVNHKSLILTDENPDEFTKCSRCVRALERKPE